MTAFSKMVTVAGFLEVSVFNPMVFLTSTLLIFWATVIGLVLSTAVIVVITGRRIFSDRTVTTGSFVMVVIVGVTLTTEIAGLFE